LEILFTLAFNKARQNDQSNAYKIYEKNYEKIIQVREKVFWGTSRKFLGRDGGVCELWNSWGSDLNLLANQL
jgi:hypothetical protein